MIGLVQIICKEFDFKQEIVSYKYLNKAAFVADAFGYYNPTDNITLRAGIYNIFNRKYHNWDALRGINAHSTTNTVDREGKALNVSTHLVETSQHLLKFVFNY